MRDSPEPIATPKRPPSCGEFGSTRKPPASALKFGVNSKARSSSSAYAVPLEPELQRHGVGPRQVESRDRGVIGAVEAGGSVRVAKDPAGCPEAHAAGDRRGACARAVGERPARELAHAPVVRQPRGGLHGRGVAAAGRRGVYERRLGGLRGQPVVVGHAQLHADASRRCVRPRCGLRGARVGLEAAVAVEVPLVLDDRAAGVARCRPVEGHRLTHGRRRGGDREGRERRLVGRHHGHGPRGLAGVPLVVGRAQLHAHVSGRGVGLRRGLRGARVGLEAAVAVEVPLVLDDRAVRVRRSGPVEGHRLAHGHRIR